MPRPNVKGALWGLTEEAQFALLRKAVVDHELVETADVVIRFNGVLQADKPQRVAPLREGERAWKTWKLLTTLEMPPDSVVADKSGKQYRVMELGDWSADGYWSYRLWEQPPFGSVALAYSTGSREPIVVVGDVLQSEMLLADDAVVLAYQKNLIPGLNGLYISLDYVGPSKCVANVNEIDPATGAEVQSCTYSHLVQVDLLSYDASARRRKEEAAMALASLYAVQQMDKYALGFARNPSPWVDASSEEPTKRLNRFTCTLTVAAVHRKVKPGAPVYTAFPGQLSTGGPAAPFAPAPLRS